MMTFHDFRRAGHFPTLVCAFVYFAVSFMCWMLPGALAISVAADFGLTDGQKGLMAALPILAGALLRIPIGMLADYFGPRRTAIAGLALTAVPLLLGGVWASSFGQILVVCLLLGIAGASF